MPNPYRGEIEACLDGKSFRLCLTLSALAELEHTFGHEDMLALAERFQSGRLSASDAQRIIGAGLRGAGHEVQDDAVGRMQTEGGAAGFVDIVARLLSATFGSPAAAIVGTLAGEMVSDLIGEKKSATDQQSAPAFPSRLDTASDLAGGNKATAKPHTPSGFPSPSCRRHVSDMTRGGVRACPGLDPGGGGEPRSPGETSAGVRPSGSDTAAPTPNRAAGASGAASGAASATSQDGVRPGGSDTVPFPGTR